MFIIQVFGKDESDLIASILGGGLITLVIASLFGVTYLRRKLQKQLSIESHIDYSASFSRTPVQAGITAHKANIPAFFSLNLRRAFRSRKVLSPSHILFGHQETRKLIDSILFPHRGLWSLNAIEATISDSLGFARLSWDIPLDQGVEVSAKPIPIRPLPIVAASSRSGDQLNESMERSGDLFDIKAYDPSDGVKRILWKIYAKSGDVVVRRPEPAIIPEGEVAIYLVANRRDDHVAGALQSYLEMLYRNQITVLFGTDGITASRHSFRGAQQRLAALKGAESERLFVSLPADIQRAINRSVWSIDAGSANGFEAFLEALESDGRVIRKVIVFAPAERSNWFKQIGPIAAQHNVSLSIASVPKELDPHIVPSSKGSNPLSSGLEKIWPFGRSNLPTEEAENAKNLILLAAKNGTEVLSCQSSEMPYGGSQ
jgi:uncharacterized protein (DUF58 family)